mgnify:FL=1
MSSPEGLEIIRLYNEYNPLILTLIEEDALIKNELKNTIDGLIPFIKDILANSFPNKNGVNLAIPGSLSE